MPCDGEGHEFTAPRQFWPRLPFSFHLLPPARPLTPDPLSRRSHPFFRTGPAFSCLSTFAQVALPASSVHPSPSAVRSGKICQMKQILSSSTTLPQGRNSNVTSGRTSCAAKIGPHPPSRPDNILQARPPGHFCGCLRSGYLAAGPEVEFLCEWLTESVKTHESKESTTGQRAQPGCGAIGPGVCALVMLGSLAVRRAGSGRATGLCAEGVPDFFPGSYLPLLCPPGASSLHESPLGWQTARQIPPPSGSLPGPAQPIPGASQPHSPS